MKSSLAYTAIGLSADVHFRGALIQGLVFTILATAAAMGGRASAQPFAGGSLPAMVERTAPSVVNISVVKQLEKSPSPLVNDPVLGPLVPGAYRFDTAGSSGSGVIINAERGVVVTNHHVIERAREIKVTLRDRREFNAKLAGSDPATDIAVLIITPDNLSAMTVANSDRVRVGETVVAIGNPYGLGQSVTAGIVSALGRSLKMDGYEEAIQTDAPINPGNSGGALTNADGQLVGINTSIWSPITGSGNVGIGFAVPTNMMMAVVDQLLRFGEVRRGKAGLASEDVTPQVARERNLRVTEGARVTRVDGGSSAEKAGMRPGDVVIAVSGRPVANQAALRNRLAMVPVGESVEVTYLRGGSKETTRVAIDPVSTAPARGGDVTIPQLPGARMGNHPEGGVEVSAVDAQSPSHELGLRAGDIIDAMDLQPVPNLEVFRRLLDKAQVVMLGVVRGDTKVKLRYRASY